jgi:hypothetical protein
MDLKASGKERGWGGGGEILRAERKETQKFLIHKLRVQIANANIAKHFHTAVRKVNKVTRSEEI